MDNCRKEAPDIDIQIQENRLVWKGWSTHRVITYDMTRRDGRRQTQTMEVNDHGHGIAVLPYNPATGRGILIRQFRLPCWLSGHKQPLWEVCAGLLDGDESPEECAHREIHEETGLKHVVLASAGRAYTSPGSLTEHMHLFLATYDTPPDSHAGGGLAEEGEDIEVCELPLAIIARMSRNGAIQDLKTLLLIRTLEAGQPRLF
jgi:nudix-type nucleoside diphosphatase (YffH/AdpP family)